MIKVNHISEYKVVNSTANETNHDDQQTSENKVKIIKDDAGNEYSFDPVSKGFFLMSKGRKQTKSFM